VNFLFFFIVFDFFIYTYRFFSFRTILAILMIPDEMMMVLPMMMMMADF